MEFARLTELEESAGVSAFSPYPISAKVVGATPFQTTAPLWASDHAGVVATVRLSWW